MYTTKADNQYTDGCEAREKRYQIHTQQQKTGHLHPALGQFAQILEFLYPTVVLRHFAKKTSMRFFLCLAPFKNMAHSQMHCIVSGMKNHLSFLRIVHFLARYVSFFENSNNYLC